MVILFVIIDGTVRVFGRLKRMGLTAKERASIIERDNGECQFPSCPDKGSDKKINCTPEKLNVHHILPQRFCEKYGVDPDFAENLITICQGCHIGSPDGVHPDAYQARVDFHEDPESFKKMGEARNERLKNRIPCWNTIYDRAMSVVAARNTQQAEKTGWEFYKKEDHERKT